MATTRRDYMSERDSEISTTIAGYVRTGRSPHSGPVPPTRPPSRNWAQIIIAVGVVLTLCYIAEVVLVVMLASTLLAFILAPVVDFSAISACRAASPP